MTRLLGIDIGTTATKALVIDDTGRVLESASASIPLSTPQPGWAEQDPDDWWQAVQSCLSQLKLTFDAIGVTGQMHGSVFLDGAGEVICPALLWCDQRTESESLEIDHLIGAEKYRSLTCNPPLTGFQAPKILWLRKNKPHLYSRIQKILLPKDYIVHKLTGEFSTDVSDASGTGLLDCRKRKWSDDILNGLDLNSEWFPEVHESSIVVGRSKLAAAVVAGAGDQAAGAVGVGSVRPGVTSMSLGTSGVTFTAIETPVPDTEGSVHVFCHANRAWHAMGVMLSCGGALRWVRDTFFPDKSYDELAVLASQPTLCASEVVFQPNIAGERCPFVDPAASGAFLNLRMSDTPVHILQAVFMGITFGMALCAEKVATFGGHSDEILLTGGGARSHYWAQLIADTTNRKCLTLEVDEGPAFGAAILAGVGIGVWPDVLSAAKKVIREKSRFVPSGRDFSKEFSRYRESYSVLKDRDTNLFGLK